ncbi:MAG: hypothetical protein FWF05_03500 [Oscillospiraceae bacterium]|nr:hypothetical protein [Oscillospiraceae bacterium]
MKKNDIYLGIDGGGSKTTAIAVNSLGEILAREVGGSINYYSNELAVTRTNMTEILEHIAEKTGVREYKGAFIGMSALNRRATEEELERFAGGVIAAEHIGMDSDLYVAMETLLTGGSCAVVISGTGSMAIARDGGGRITTAGGWGYLLGDEGSGYAISLAGIRAGIRGFESSGPATALTQALRGFYKTDDLYKLIDMFYDPPMDRSSIAQFVREVRACAESGDSVAGQLIASSADDLAETAMSVLRHVEDDAPIGLWGGVFQHTPMFTGRFTENLARHDKRNVFLLRYPPEIGAVFAAYKLCGVELTSAMLDNINAHI